MLEIRGYKNISKLMEMCSTFSLFIILFNRTDKVIKFESNKIQFGENSLQKLKVEVIMIAKNLREIIPFLYYFSRGHRFFGKGKKSSCFYIKRRCNILRICYSSYRIIPSSSIFIYAIF